MQLVKDAIETYVNSPNLATLAMILWPFESWEVSFQIVLDDAILMRLAIAENKDVSKYAQSLRN